jgi:hypothetical protein
MCITLQSNEKKCTSVSEPRTSVTAREVSRVAQYRQTRTHGCWRQKKEMTVKRLCVISPPSVKRQKIVYLGPIEIRSHTASCQLDFNRANQREL